MLHLHIRRGSGTRRAKGWAWQLVQPCRNHAWLVNHSCSRCTQAASTSCGNDSPGTPRRLTRRSQVLLQLLQRLPLQRRSLAHLLRLMLQQAPYT